MSKCERPAVKQYRNPIAAWWALVGQMKAVDIKIARISKKLGEVKREQGKRLLVEDIAWYRRHRQNLDQRRIAAIDQIRRQAEYRVPQGYTHHCV